MVNRTPSEEQWIRVNEYVRTRRHELSSAASGHYPAGRLVAGTTLVSAPAWLPAHPIPLQRIRLEFRPDAPPPAVPVVAALAPCALPERPDGTRYRSYSEATVALAAPAIFENRPTYRLLQANLADSSDPRLVFGRGRFFDGIDVGGPASHEYAAWRLGLVTEPKFRAVIGDSSNLEVRAATLATCALTLRHDRPAGVATFPLHRRDPLRVAHAGGMYQVIPVGIFQPSGEAPWNEANDFSLWRGLVREYAEELLGIDEDYGSEDGPIDYDRWPLAAAMTTGLRDGRVRAWCLGLGADPLTFALDLLVAVVIDAPLYDQLFGDLVSVNAEGLVIQPRPFDEATVTELLGSSPFQSAAAALLTLALRHRETLLG